MGSDRRSIFPEDCLCVLTVRGRETAADLLGGARGIWVRGFIGREDIKDAENCGVLNLVNGSLKEV